MAFARVIPLQNFADDMSSSLDVFTRSEPIDIVRQEMVTVGEGGALWSL